MSVSVVTTTATLYGGSRAHTVEIRLGDQRLVAQNVCATGPGKSPDLARCAHLALEHLESITRDARAQLEADGLVEKERPKGAALAVEEAVRQRLHDAGLSSLADIEALRTQLQSTEAALSARSATIRDLRDEAVTMRARVDRLERAGTELAAERDGARIQVEKLQKHIQESTKISDNVHTTHDIKLGKLLRQLEEKDAVIARAARINAELVTRMNKMAPVVQAALDQIGPSSFKLQNAVSTYTGRPYEMRGTDVPGLIPPVVCNGGCSRGGDGPPCGKPGCV